ncbi:hypothetical protein F5879DRAFT_1067360 [Lentinula edodes]|nr:hypothetical protein F5879DRAFT_1067360 [Lentinula edodes]
MCYLSHSTLFALALFSRRLCSLVWPHLFYSVHLLMMNIVSAVPSWSHSKYDIFPIIQSLQFGCTAMYPVPAYPSHTRNRSQLLTKWTTMMVPRLSHLSSLYLVEKSEGKGLAPHHIEVNASCTLSTRDDVTQTIMKNSLYQCEGIVSDIVARHILNGIIRLGELEGIIKRLCPQLAPEIYDFFTEVGRLYCAMVINLPKVICPYQRQPHLEITIRGAYLRWKRLDASSEITYSKPHPFLPYTAASV